MSGLTSIRIDYSAFASVTMPYIVSDFPFRARFFYCGPCFPFQTFR